MALTQDQLQSIVDQVTTDLFKVKQVINGDNTTTVTLFDGSVIPSFQKLIYDIQAQATTNLQTAILGNLQLLTNDLLKNMHPVLVYQLQITPQNAGTFIQITLDDLIGVQKFMINGLEEPNDGSVFTITGQTINIPPSDNLQNLDVVTIRYFTND